MTSRWTTLERWGPVLFLIGGSLLVMHAALLGLQAFSEMTPPPDVFGPAGHLVGLVGLIGLYPALTRRTPTTARTGGVVGVVALSGWAVMAGGRLLAVVGAVSPLSDVLPGVFFMLLFVSTILTYVLFGVATVRVDDGPRAVGPLVLAPAVLLGVGLVASALTGVSAFGGFVIGGGLAMSMLMLGYTLRTWDSPADLAPPAGDPTTG